VISPGLPVRVRCPESRFHKHRGTVVGEAGVPLDTGPLKGVRWFWVKVEAAGWKSPLLFHEKELTGE
jgi:hypothetical protein